MNSMNYRTLQGFALWLFAAFASAQNQTADTVPAPALSALIADLDNGSTIYDNACRACHGETGQGGQGGVAPLTESQLSLSQIMLVIDAGRNTMPAFGVLSDQELLDVSTYVDENF